MAFSFAAVVSSVISSVVSVAPIASFAPFVIVAFFDKNDTEAGINIRWIVPNSQKNDMEPILITLAGKTKTAPDDPHPGEEFGYILKGSVVLHLGQKQYKTKKGECFYYRADTAHFLENSSASPAVILWLSSPPMF